MLPALLAIPQPFCQLESMNSFFLIRILEAIAKQQLSLEFTLCFRLLFEFIPTLDSLFYSNLNAIFQRFLYLITNIHSLSA